VYNEWSGTNEILGGEKMKRLKLAVALSLVLALLVTAACGDAGAPATAQRR
jgi:hypothetical protein